MNTLPVIVSPSIVPPSSPTLSDLIAAYRTDPDSRFCKPGKLRFATRQNYTSLMARIERDYGYLPIAEIDVRQILRMHEAWVGPGNRIPMAHSLVGMLRTLATYGASFMRSAVCREMKAVLHDQRFTMPKARKEVITTEQAIAVIKQAHAMDLHSVAFAQALQTSGMFRQKDVIGEWVPVSEPGHSDIIDGAEKWQRGLLWSELSDDLVLTHVTSKRGKELIVDLKLAPLVMAELRRIAAGKPPDRNDAMIVNEATNLPYRSYQFRRLWRMVATAVGIPAQVYNMDSRAGAITEALSLGAPMQSVRKAATHSTEAMTQKYSRREAEASDEVLSIRAVEHERLLATP